MQFPCSFFKTLPGLGRIIGLLAVAAALTACSAIKLAYNNFDEVSYWWLDSYVDFSSEQSVRVREDLDRLHLWHRAQELPRLAAMLRAMEQLAPGDIAAAQACAFVPQLRERVQAVAVQAEPMAVTLAISLAPEQLAHLQRKYERNNEDFRKQWISASAADRADKRFRQFLERAEMIYGGLDDPQREVLRRELEQSTFDASRILAERQRRQQDALQILRRLAGQAVALEEARRLLHGYVERILESPDPAYRSYQNGLFDEGCRTFAALHNSTTPVQRESAVRRLRAYQRSLGELAAQR